MLQHLLNQMLGLEPQQFMVGALALAVLLSYTPSKE
jgi:hypothetical protein